MRRQWPLRKAAADSVWDGQRLLMGKTAALLSRHSLRCKGLFAMKAPPAAASLLSRHSLRCKGLFAVKAPPAAASLLSRHSLPCKGLLAMKAPPAAALLLSRHSLQCTGRFASVDAKYHAGRWCPTV